MAMRLSDIAAQQPEAPEAPKAMRLGDLASMPRVDAPDLSDGILKIDGAQRQEWEKRGSIGFMEQLRRTDKTEMIPFNPESATKSVGLLMAVNRLRDDKTPPEQRKKDEELFQTFLTRSEEERIRGFSVGGRIAQGATQLPAYMLEFLATGPVVGGTRVALKKGLGEATKKIVESGVLKATTRVAGGVLGATARTAAMPHRLVEGYADRQLNAGLELTDKGLEIAKTVEEAPHTSALKSFGDVMIENFSEVTGGAIGKAGAAMVPSAIRNGLEKMFKRLKPNEAVNRLWTQAGFHGFLSEVGEERVGSFLRAVTGVEDFGADNPDSVFDRVIASIPNGEDMLVEAAVLAFPGALGFTTSQAVALVRKRKQEAGHVEPTLKDLSDEEIDKIVAVEEAPAPKEPKPDPVVQAVAVRENVAAQLKEAGFAEEDATAQAQLYEAGLRTLANQAGMDPNALYEKYGLTIQRTDTQPEVAAADVGETVAAQDELFQGAEAQPKAPTFFSAVETALNSKMPAKASGDQVLGMLKNFPGVKQEELDTIGLPEFLKEQKGAVSKEAVLEFVKQGGVQIQEVTKGGKRAFAEWADSVMGVAPADFSTLSSSEQNELREQYDQTGSNTDRTDGTKFDKYTLPGGENYRELLFTLPETVDPTKGFYISQVGDRFKVFRPDGEVWGDYAQRETAVEALASRVGPSMRDKDFHSSHFSEPNILAHVRFNERTDAEGKKVLFIEEVQSDWHQKGRDQGYQTSSNAVVTIEKEGRTFNVIRDGIAVWSGLNEERANRIAEAQRAQKREGVPDAPFKKTWHELALKRMIRYAAENGFERIAWTTGEQQAERYDLSKHIDSLGWWKTPEGKYGILAKKDGKMVTKTTEIPPETLDQHVGKELAQKIIAGEGQSEEASRTYGPKIAGNLSGFDLKVGGEGMKGFYDQIIPSFLNKYTKKWGGRVGTTRVNAFENWTVQRSDGEREEFVRQIDAERRAAGLAGAEVVAPTSGENVHALDISPTMKDAVLNVGQPLFQGEAAPRGSIQFGPRGTIINLFKQADRSTFLHETGHFYLKVLGDLSTEKNATPALKRDSEVVLNWLGAKSFDTITREQNEKFAKGFEAYLMEGRAPTEGLRGAFERFKNWLTEIYKEVQSLGVELSPEVRDVFDRILGKTEAPTLELAGNEAYAINRRLSAKPQTKNQLAQILSDAGKFADEFVGTISTRLKNINPEIKAALRRFEYDVRQSAAKDLAALEPMLLASQKMTEADNADFDFARKNGDIAVMEPLARKYGIDLKVYQRTLDAIHARAQAVGFEIGYIENYHPRMVRDVEGLLNHFQKDAERRSLFLQAVREKEAQLNRVLNDEEKATLINQMLRGYDQGKIKLSRTSNMKGREIKELSAEMNVFYYHSDQALMNYIQKVNESIEARRFFGKGSPQLEFNNVEDSIGAYTLDLIEQGKITPEKEIELRDILRARFNYRGTSGTVGLYKNLAYMDTLGSPISAITQIEDLGMVLYKSALETPGSLLRAIVNKSKITTKQLGIDTIAEELRESTRTASGLRKLLKVTGFSALDRIGKETYVNAVINRYRKKAKKPDPEFLERLTATFGNDYQGVLEDLKSGNTTEAVQLLAFNELLEVQPIALSEMPQKYLENPNGRLFYSLKTFMLKRLDYLRNEIIQEAKKPGLSPKIRASRRFLHLYGLLIVLGIGVDALKDFILGRETEPEDRLFDNMLKPFGLSKFFIYKARQEGLASATARLLFLPPTKVFDAIFKDVLVWDWEEEGADIFTGNLWEGEPLELTASIPIGGKLYYWWYGAGSEKEEKDSD